MSLAKYYGLRCGKHGLGLNHALTSQAVTRIMGVDLNGVETPVEQTMLVLSRRRNESIIIADDVTITIVEIRGDKVRIGIEAPKEIPVHRREVWLAINGNQPPMNEETGSPA